MENISDRSDWSQSVLQNNWQKGHHVQLFRMDKFA